MDRSDTEVHQYILEWRSAAVFIKSQVPNTAFGFFYFLTLITVSNIYIISVSVKEFTFSILHDFFNNSLNVDGLTDYFNLMFF